MLAFILKFAETAEFILQRMMRTHLGIWFITKKQLFHAFNFRAL